MIPTIADAGEVTVDAGALRSPMRLLEIVCSKPAKTVIPFTVPPALFASRLYTLFLKILQLVGAEEIIPLI